MAGVATFHVETVGVNKRRVAIVVTVVSAVAVGALGFALGKACE